MRNLIFMSLITFAFSAATYAADPSYRCKVSFPKENEDKISQSEEPFTIEFVRDGKVVAKGAPHTNVGSIKLNGNKEGKFSVHVQASTGDGSYATYSFGFEPYLDAQGEIAVPAFFTTFEVHNLKSDKRIEGSLDCKKE